MHTLYKSFHAYVNFMSYIDNLYKAGLVCIVGLLIVSAGFAEQLYCNKPSVSYTNNKIVCFYTPKEEEYLDPKIEGTIAAEKIDYTPQTITPNSSWTFTIYLDIDSTKAGMQDLIISQGTFKQKFNIFVSKSDIISLDKAITYEQDTGLVILKLKNNSKNKINLTLKYNFPDSYKAVKESESLTLAGKTQISLKIPFRYLNPDYKKGEIVILYKLENQQKVKKELVKFDPYLVPYQGSSNLTPYFLLTNNKVMLGLDIVLLLIAIVLFTMFIGRLGKKIVKEGNI